MPTAIGTSLEIFSSGWFTEIGLPDATSVFLNGWWSGLEADDIGEVVFTVNDGIIKNIVMGGQVQDYYVAVN